MPTQQPLTNIFVALKRATTTTSGQSGLTKGHIVAAHAQHSLYFTVGSLPTSKLPLPMGDLIQDSLGQSEPTTQMEHLCWFNHFCTAHEECPYTLQWPAPTHGGIWTPSNTRYSGSTQVLNPNGISIGQDVFAWLTTVTD